MNQPQLQKLLATSLAFLIALSLQGEASAKFAAADLVKVPVDRLAKNIKEWIKADPKNATLHLNLARLYAMSHSLKTEEAEVNKRNNDRVWFGYTPLMRTRVVTGGSLAMRLETYFSFAQEV